MKTRFRNSRRRPAVPGRWLVALLGVLALGRPHAALAQGEREEAPPPRRPRIGLVLGGGGALGIAHVGILKVLETERIPVDCIGGTSMGAIVAGLYAAGLAPEEIEKTLVGVDWWEVLKDQTPRRDLHFRRKQDDKRYLFDLELGLRGWHILAPTGLAAGQKFNNIMQTLTLSTAGIDDFDRLNIPFRAVATDAVTGKAVILDRGNLATAMRASMAVPGLFTPVAIEGRLLVDGGVVNNVPVDVVRGMGADLVIAVDVGAIKARPDARKLENVAGILSRTYAILTRPRQDAQLAQADIVILPDVSAFSAADFHRAAGIIPCGVKAAQQAAETLRRHSVSREEYDRFLRAQRRRPAGDIVVSRVVTAGNRLVDDRIVRRRIRTQPGDTLDFARLNADLARIHGLGDFQTVSYRLRPDGDKYELNCLMREKPWGPAYLHMGLRLQSNMDNEANWQVLLNYTRTRLNPLGAEWRADLQGGSVQRLFTEFYQPLSFAGTFFVAPSIDVSDQIRDVYEDDDRIARYDVRLRQGRLDLGIQMSNHGEARAGAVVGHGKAQTDAGATALPGFDEPIGAWALQFVLDRLDNAVFARHGYLIGIEAFLAREFLGGTVYYDRVRALYDQFFTRGAHTAQVSLKGGTSLGSTLPPYDEFLLGGPFSLAGLAQDQLRGQYFAAGSLGYRYRLVKLPPSLGEGVYIGARADAGNVWGEQDDINADDLRYGLLLAIGADTVLGPAVIGWGHADGGENQAFLSLGTTF
ncbi:MAG: patatin-like phospholipase family protein [Kiritimatiellae bacterium]|nr:patatin-like phospholipase family protein [Kiritimatiellia bacterium]